MRNRRCDLCCYAATVDMYRDLNITFFDLTMRTLILLAVMVVQEKFIQMVRQFHGVMCAYVVASILFTIANGMRVDTDPLRSDQLSAMFTHALHDGQGHPPWVCSINFRRLSEYNNIYCQCSQIHVCGWLHYNLWDPTQHANYHNLNFNILSASCYNFTVNTTCCCKKHVREPKVRKLIGFTCIFYEYCVIMQ